MNNATMLNHPLIQHKLSVLRDVKTGSKEFRELIEEITILTGFEATRDLPLKEVTVETPIQTAKALALADKHPVIVPILRAGLGMVEGMLKLIPTAKVGHIGLARDPITVQPVEYYCKLPEDINERTVIVVDPMLATGGSAADAITMLKKRGCKNIRFICIIAAPEGIKKLSEAHPDVQIYCAAADEKLNDHCYIVPGLGDAGDRIFGTN